MIVGTAGHIDHGKTALVKALTGVDADRLKEEKARGITIDLGFAYTSFVAERITGFVDVPGHERFIHTMLAGAGGVDFALLVIAADDGIMPQTREHLAILDLLGVSRGAVALTKCDLADDARRASLTGDIHALLARTSLANAPVLPVSALTGAGIEALRDLFAQAERDTPVAHADGPFRLAVDRSFTLAGAGIVVTGTVLSGSVAIGDRVTISPSGLTARVRGIHAQNARAERGVAGQRCALNLAGHIPGKDAISRGDVVLDPVLHAPTARIDAELRLLASEAKPVGAWFPARLHHASAEVGARIVPLEGDIAPGATGRVQLVLDRPIAAACGDRFVLRDVSAQRTIGGGRFLDLRAPARKRRTPERLAFLDACGERDPEQVFARLLETPPYVVDVDAFARDHALPAARVAAFFSNADAILLPAETGDAALGHDQWTHFRRGIVAELARFHEENAELQGMGREKLRLVATPRLPAKAFLTALQRLVGEGCIALDGAFVRLPTHEVRLSAADETLWDAIAPSLAGDMRFRPPRVRDLAATLDVTEGDVRRVLKLCARLGRVDQIAHDHFFLRATTAEMVRLAADAASHAANGEFTAAQFRDRMDNGRKVAIQILDFFDRHGVTLRRGDLRRMNMHRLDLFAEDGRETSPVGRPDFKSGWGSETVPGGFDSHSLPPRGVA